MEYRAEKRALRQFLNSQGVKITTKKPPTLRCPNLAHGGDNNPTAILYENQDVPQVHCPKCNESWTVFEVAGLLHNVSEFKDKLKIVRSSLNITDKQEPAPVIKKPDTKTPIALTRDEARKVYTPDAVARENKTVVKSWPYTDENDNIIALDVRYENADSKKEIITYWYDGKLRWYKTPVFIYNLYEALNTDKPLLIVEGAKCAELARELTDFTPVSWSGGSAKADKPDWSIFAGRDVYIYPDDDTPGIKAAEHIKKQLTNAVIIKPVLKARAIKKQGADIEEALKIMSPDELQNYIKGHTDGPLSPNTPDTLSTPAVLPSASGDEGLSVLPFKILGVNESGAHFIDQWGYYQQVKLSTLTKTKLNNIADTSYWNAEFPKSQSFDVDEAINYVISLSKSKEFDENCLRGRGAWRDEDGKLSYHDGCKTFGGWDKDYYIYLKLPRKKIGIGCEPAPGELLLKIRDLIFELSFETKVDAVRTMSWSVVAPFCGALEHRPTLMLTGHSGTGKTKVQKLVIEKLSNFEHLDLRTSTEAGIRRLIGRDSRAIFFDEAGKESEKMKLNFDAVISFIRSNFSEDSPDGVKAAMNSDGVVRSKMFSIFGFASTDPTIENAQDENRLLRVNFKKPQHTAKQWQKIESELKSLMTKENCDKIRALVWSRLNRIEELAREIVQIARDKTNRDYRSSYADMLLAAAYMVIWCDTPEPTEEQIEQVLDKYYSGQHIEENRDESVEIINRILDEIIEVNHDHNREKITIIEMISRLHYDEIENENGETEIVTPTTRNAYIRHLAMYGIKIVGKDGLHFANKNHMIKKITGLSDGYERLLSRHPNADKGFKNPVTYPGGVSKRGTLINGLIPGREGHMSFVEQARGGGFRT